MKRFTLVIIFIILNFQVLIVLAQDHLVIDSLEKLLHQPTKNDTIRVNLLNEASEKLYQIDIEKALKYAEEAGQLANKLDFKKGKAESLRFFGEFYSSKSDYPQALKNYQKSLNLFEEIGDKHKVSVCFKSIGIVYYYQGNFSESLEYYQKSLQISKELGDNKIASSCLNNIGIVHSYQGNYPQALEYYQKSLKIKEDIEDKSGISMCLNNIGIIYLNQGNYPQALEYYQKSLKNSEELGNTKGISLCFNNIGIVLSYQGNYIKSLEYFQKSLKIVEDLSDVEGISSCLSNIGETHFNQGNYPEALEYFQKSLKMYEGIGSQYGICLSYVNLGAGYLKIGSYTKALDYSLKSLKIANELELLEMQKNIHEQLSEIYAATKNYKKAYENYMLYKERNDSIFNEENIKKITGLEYQYEYEKEKQAIELKQQKKDAVFAEEAKLQKMVRNTFIAGFILMLILVLVVLRSFLQKRKANHTLAIQKQRITETNEELFQQKEEMQAQAEELAAANQKLQELDKFKDEMTEMIVHDLKNPLNSIIGLAENDIVKQAGKRMLNMVMNILDVQKFEDTEIKLETTNNSIYEVSKLALKQVNLLYEQKNIKVENNIQNYFVDIDSEIIERVFVNILTNAIKFTPNNGTITLESQEYLADFIRIRILDTGIGIPDNKLVAIFGKFEQVIAKRAGITRSTGIGLAFCKLFIEAHGCEIGVETEIENLSAGKVGGTTFWFTLPANKQSNNEIIIKEENVKEKSIELTPTDKQILKPFLSKLQALEVYESSDIEKIIEQIDFSKTQNLEKWKKEMDNVLYAMNEEKYKELIEMIN